MKGYDYHLCRCGAYYCDDFKNTVEHKYEYDPDGVHQSPTFKETGCRSFICERCGDKYTEMLPCPADVDTEAIEEYAKNYAREKGFTVVDFIEEAPRKHFHSTIIPIYEPFMLVDNLEKHLKRRMGGLIYSAAQQVDRPRLEAEDYNIYIDVSLEGNFELCVRIEEKE